MASKSESKYTDENFSITHCWGTDKFGLIGIVLILGYYIPNTTNLWFNPSSEGFWRDIYEYMYYDLFGGNELYILSIGAVISHVIGYWSMGIPFIIFDLIEKPAFIYKYKIKDEKYHKVTYSELVRLTKRCLFNQIFVSIPFATFAYFIFKWRGCHFGPDEVPGLTTTMLVTFAHAFMFEISFYYLHRMMHLPIIYKHIHKRHHEWASPVSVTSFYVHPIDQLLSVYFPLLCGILVTGGHAYLTVLWVYLGANLGVLEHVGYKFPLYPSPELHTIHHQTFTEFYGASEVFDWFHGTNNVKKYSSISPHLNQNFK